MIVIGTALAVNPFASIVGKVDEKTPKVLINMTPTQDYDFEDKEYYPERIFLQGKCDEVVAKISKDCGWEDEFKARIQNCKTQSADDLIKQMEGLTIADKNAEEKKESEKESKGKNVDFSTGQNNVSNKLKVPASQKKNSRSNSSASKGSQNSAGSKGSTGSASKGGKVPVKAKTGAPKPKAAKK